ncbi:hypothetical protein SCHPADRAFT_885815 [Schizopora paradoxa]|uniref:Uncharacterized protein n=1 Tax=Schizopora paradoxa TaxID=27342 RepID=A0A0H2S4B3_9AGAM|nr:hypothetical protein SCHPADRAFT_885815 [Schizopora paradoxa]
MAALEARTPAMSSHSVLSPLGSYTPSVLQCPSNISFVRPASEGLSPTEAAWLQKRRPNVIAALESYLDRVGIPGFNTSEYIQALIENDAGHWPGTQRWREREWQYLFAFIVRELLQLFN